LTDRVLVQAVARRAWLALPLVLVWACGGDPTAPPSGAASPREDRITVESDGARLAATVVEPADGGPHPALVVVHGSGRETGATYRSVADDFVAEGYVALVYDKRGVGGSSGTYFGVGPLNSERILGELASDALACLEALRSRPSVDPARVGLLGFSQAGWIIPLAASRSPQVAFMVLISCFTCCSIKPWESQA
jgi:hypothetical protein